MKLMRGAVLLLLGMGMPSPAVGQSLPIGFVDEQVIGGLNLPTAFAQLPDDRILITEKDGLVRVLKNGALLPAPFIDLRNSVNDYWDHGLLGIAADLNFVSNHYVYLFYVYENDAIDYTGPKTSRLTRVTASGDVASPSSEVVILGTVVGSSCKNFPAGSDCIPADNPSHTVGSIKVADDGTLFVTHGDGASFNVVDDDALRSLDVDSLAGKLLHITTAGAGLPENPFWNGNAAANRSKVYAYGLRNPYRFAIHPASRAIFLGDVGWGEWEEVDRVSPVAPGTNFGWPCYEGPPHQSGYEPKATCQSLYALEPNGAAAPTIAYHHPQNTSSAVTAGVFYPGTTFPAQYRGAFFYGDYAQGFLRYMQVAADGSVAGPVIGFAAGVGGPVYIDTDGENLLYVAINTGEIRRIRYANPNTTNSYLSDRTWTSATNGWGPTERDMSNGENGALDGSVLKINGAIYAKGLGVNSPSDIRYPLGGSCSAFAAVVGMDDDTGSGGTVVFQVYTDGALRYDSGVMTGATAAKNVNLSVTGVNELRLVVTIGGDDFSGDHADWADARVTCSGDSTPPTVTATTPVHQASGQTVTVNATATFSEAMNASTLTTTTVTVVPQGSSTPIAATVGYDAATQTVTLDPSALLATNTTYTATVKGGTSGAKDTSGNPLATDKVWTFTTAGPGASIYVSDMTWTSSMNGYGPAERDKSNGEDLGGDGATITLNGLTFAKGIGLHAYADIRVPVAGGCSVFTAVVGVDDEVGPNGSVVFQVWTDGIKKYDSGVVTGVSGLRSVNVPIAGAIDLALIMTDGGDGSDYDHGDWAQAQVGCSADTAAPTVTVVSPANGASGVSVTANTTATFSESMNVSTFNATTVTLIPQGSSTPVAAIVTYDGPTRTVTLDPAASLVLTTMYTARIKGGSGGAKDLAGNALATDKVWTFTTASSDVTPPTVTTVSPTDAATAQAISVNATATFSEAMNASTLTTTTVTLVPQGSSTPVPATVSYDAPTQRVTLDPSASLAASTTYTATVKGGSSGAKDLAGNPLATDKVWTFTTAGPGAAIYVSDMTWTSAANGYGPAERDRSNGEDLAGDGATLTLNGATYAKGIGVHAPADIRVALGGGCSVFTAVVGLDDEVGANGSVVFQVWTDGVKRYDSGVMTGSGASGSVNVTIGGASQLALIVTDGSNGSDYDHADWADAQVSCPDVTAPTVTVVSPANGATGVAVTANTTATFSEAMNASTLTGTTVTLLPQGSSTPITAIVSYDAPNKRVTLDPTSDLAASTTYTATVKGGASGATDVAGNPLATDKVWSFMTAALDVTPPSVTTVSPANGAIGVAVTANTTATFSEAMNPSTLTTSTVTLIPQGSSTSVPASVTYNSGTLTVTLDPTSSLATGTTYNATVKGGASGATDLAGNPLATDKLWSFTTLVPDGTPPTVTTVTPSNGAVGQAVTVNATATFSEAMNASTLTATTVTLVPQGSSTPVPATVTYDGPSMTVTLNPTSSLAANTIYTATVKGGSSGAKDVAGNPLASDKVWTFTTAGIATYVSDMTWTSESNGLGPAERDKSNGQGLAGDGGTLTLNGVPYTKGLGVHAPSDIRVALGSACSAFTAVVGVDDEVGLNGSVVLQVWTDGVKRYDSGTMTGATASANVSVPLAGVSLLALVVTDAADGISDDHADWANPQVSCSFELTPPTVVTVTPANGATGQALTANTTATFSEAMNPATLTTTTVTLVPQGSTTPLPASVSYNAGTNTVTLDPGANLVANTTYTATIKGGSSGAKDAAGNALAADKAWTFSTSAPPTATIAQPLATFKFKVGDVITYSGSATDSDQSTIPSANLHWDVVLHHCPGGSCHSHPFINSNGSSGTFTAPDHGDESYFQIVLTATNSAGLTGTASVDILPQTVQLTLATSVPGLQVVYGGTSATSPATYTTIVGSTHTIHAPSPQGVLSFINWSDGGAQQHNVVAGATDVTFTATFADITAPTVPTVGPASGATGVAQAANTTAVFSEPMNASTLNTTTVTLVPQGSSTPVAAVVTYDSATKTVTLNPLVDMADTTTYTATIKGGAAGAKDPAGNALAADKVWSFTTVDLTPPTVTTVTPALGATGVARGANVTAVFSEPMLASSITTATVALVRQGTTTPVNAAVTYNATTRTVTLNPNGNLAANTLYTATIKGGSTGVKAAAGDALTIDKVWTFTTGS